MSDTFATDLYTKLAAIPALANSVGFAVGGKQSDPAMTKVPLPAAWLLLGRCTPIEKSKGMVARIQSCNCEYWVRVYIPYISQSDLINIENPLLELIRTTIHATNAPNDNRWEFIDRSPPLLINPDRIGYLFVFSVIRAI